MSSGEQHREISSGKQHREISSGEHQIHTRKGMDWSRQQAPDILQKRDGLVLTSGPRYTPEEGWTVPDIRPQIVSRRGMDCP